MPLQDENTNPQRKRNNSLIPIELLNNSGEGGRECAALATVFGVPEYVDSKIFWERQQYQHEGLLPKKQVTRPGTPSDNSKYGHVSVNHISVVKRPIGKVSQEDNDAMNNNAILQHDIRSKFVISSYVDSVLDPVGSNELLRSPSLGTTSTSAPIPTPSKSFSLPRIPNVSKFNDILIEDENGIDIMLPANPSSILLHSTTPIIRSGSISSVHSNYTLPSLQKQQDIKETQVIIGSPEIFDLIISDEDERFIIWGPDPIALSSSMATTTSPERPSSYATLYNNQHTRPELKGFSSNTTSTLVTSKSSNHISKERKPSFASVRLSAQLLSENLKLGRSTKSSDNMNDHAQHSSFLLKKAFGLKKSNNKKSVKDQEMESQKDIPKVIEAATIHKLVEKLTNTLDYTFMTDFFLTYRDFLSSIDLCQLLMSRFYWALQNDEETRRVVRIRTFVVLRHWLNNYFVHDFIGNRSLRVILTEFLNQLPRHPLVKESPRDQRIVKILKRVVRRLKKLYYNRSSGASRVKVIAPPPPTAEQEQMGEIVRAKLSQNVIRRKTTLGVDMSSHHNGNMAVQDARYARVVVVGSLKSTLVDSPTVDTLAHRLSHASAHDIVVPEANGFDDGQSHQYNKSVHESSMAEPHAPVDASSMISVASDDSLESELSAGETVPNESDESDEDEDEEEEDGLHQTGDLDRHWLQEQQETLAYFQPVANEHPVPFDAPDVPTTELPPPSVDKADLTSENSMPTTPTSISKTGIRRVPSERWCKSDGEYSRSKNKQTVDATLPDELLKELSGDELSGSRSPVGLARKLSRKSIEKRKSEKNLHDTESVGWSSAPSSTTTSPYLTATHAEDIPKVPELPSSLEVVKKSPSKTLKKKKAGSKKKAAQTTDMNELEAFASIPYEATMAPDAKPNTTTKEDNVPKRRLSKVLSKVLRPHSVVENEKTQIKENDNQAQTEVANNEVIPGDQEAKQEEEEQQKQHGGQLVNLIAQRLRHSSVDEDNTEDNKCDCAHCSGNKHGSNITCRRLSMMLIADEERRLSLELRRKRGASIDLDQHARVNQLNNPFHQDAKQAKEAQYGPVYLGNLQARSLIESTVDHPQHDPDTSDDDDDGTSCAPSERSIQTEAQASSSRARMSFLSDVTSHGPKSKMIEVGIPPVLPALETTMTENTDIQTIPRSLGPGMVDSHHGRCFIMSYRTSLLASQLCYVERDVLVKVGWEELIHCKWTKMDACGNITTDLFSHEQQALNEDYNDKQINYTRQTEQRRIQEQGIEQVIQRFNTVCQWVASEIVRTRNIHERVKLIEKFIRLARKCQMYSNYATLLQILLGLQSPAVARLEKTWSKVSTRCQKQLNKLTEFTSPMKNWKHIRDSMTEVAEEYGNSPAEVQVELPGTTSHKHKFKKTRIKIPFGGCIPFLGIYLSDLVFNSEKPRYLKPNLENQRIYNVNNTRHLPDCLDQPLVNFRKYRVIATVIKRVLTFQGLAMRYSFDEDGFLLEKCRNLQVLDASQIRELSISLE
ncbi:uncharacterized protein B0P05DRAFT_540554 [Gilbertella persicaria]|uniref:uncharacterized protein n=1 Tax=Gilbertella persicaria TaxID=101096 RepID=UPI00221F62AC|nr:uncharacterized protein B0P05DRAFT_540554 [Gilbertella persicaria]KAI8080251.1 hypothetical protein B0P05DRAFT_540554 [Gilbertella persicaria]